MKNKVIFSLILAPCLALAGGVTVVGGGGSQIEAAFRLRAYGLILQIGNNIQANELCSASVLQAGLDSTKIQIVDSLTDPNTGKPIDQNLDAWTQPGDMQLLQSSWQFLLDPTASPQMKSDKSVSVLILHEVYRTTGSCNDDNFALSEKAFGFLQGQGASNYSEMLALKYAYWSIRTYNTGVNLGFSYTKNLSNPPEDEWTSLAPTEIMLCDTPNLTVGGSATCVTANGYLFKQRTAAPAPQPDPDETISLTPDFSFGTNPDELVPCFQYSAELQNQWELVTPLHPYVLVHDIQSGTWSCGMQ